MNNPYEPPVEEKRPKYKPPIIDTWGLFFTFTIIVIVPTLIVFILSWFI